MWYLLTNVTGSLADMSQQTQLTRTATRDILATQTTIVNNQMTIIQLLQESRITTASVARILAAMCVNQASSANAEARCQVQ